MTSLKPEQTFLVAIAAKAAVTNAPLEIHETGSWWLPMGSQWLQILCKNLSINADRLPDSPTLDDARGLASTLPDSEHGEITAALLSATLLVPVSPSPTTQSNSKSSTSSGSHPFISSSEQQLVYAASTRAFIVRTLDLLNISYRHLLSAESALSKELYKKVKEKEDDFKESSEALRKKKEDGWGGSWGRMAATVGGVTLGGVVIGLTGGLAAPALLPLLPFLTAGTAPVLLGSLFGLAGGGLTGYRVRRRWGGVEKFEFVEVVGPGEGGGNDDLKQSVEKKAPSMVTAMMVPGIQVKSEDESLEASKRCRDLFAPYEQDLYMVSHSPDVMLETGKAIKGWVMSKLYSRAGTEILKRTAFNAVLAAVSMPLSIYNTTGMLVDNQWIQGQDRARKAGGLIADVIREKVHGNRPLVLIGSSLGSTAVFEALLSLASATPTSTPTDESKAPSFDDNRKEKHAHTTGMVPLVDTAIFISLPQAPTAKQWKAIRSVVGRRVVNAYCKGDFVLAGVGRLHEVLGGAHLGGMAGLTPVPDDICNKYGIENVDISDVIEGHLNISEKMPDILARIGVDQ